MPAIHGLTYYAIPAGLANQWLIMRGRFVMSRFQGDIPALIAELQSWDETVPTGTVTNSNSNGDNTHE